MTNKKELTEAQKRINRQVELMEFEKQFNKEIAEWNKKPWWVKQSLEGDYHYNDWDMEPREENDGTK